MCVEKSLPSLFDIQLDLHFTLFFIRGKFSELFLMLLDLPLKFEPLLHSLVEGGLRLLVRAEHAFNIVQLFLRS